MQSKKEISEAKKVKLRGELNGLLKGFNETFETDKTDPTDSIIDKKLDALKNDTGTPSIDFDELDRKFKDKAKNVITTMYEFYHDIGVINESEYVQTKKELDAMNVSNIFFQLKAVKTAIKIIMDEITSGNTHPRMFESLSTLNNQFSDTIKAQANYILFLEESAKKTSMEAAEMNGNTADAKQMEESVSRNSEYYITSNPKKLLKEIQESNPLNEEESIAIEEVGTDQINPHKKENLMDDLDVVLPEDDERPDDYIDIINII